MKLWTFQDRMVLTVLKEDGVYYPNKCKSEFLEDYENGRRAYHWMENMLTEKDFPPYLGASMCWAWYAQYGKHSKPDRRRGLNKGYGDKVLLELEIPDELVLLSDYIDWHCVLNDGAIALDSDGIPVSDDKLDEWFEWYDSLPADEQWKVKLESWPHILFEDADKIDLEKYHFVQAVFWQIKWEYVKKVY